MEDYSCQYQVTNRNRQCYLLVVDPACTNCLAQDNTYTKYTCTRYDFDAENFICTEAIWTRVIFTNFGSSRPTRCRLSSLCLYRYVQPKIFLGDIFERSLWVQKDDKARNVTWYWRNVPIVEDKTSTSENRRGSKAYPKARKQSHRDTVRLMRLPCRLLATPLDLGTTHRQHFKGQPRRKFSSGKGFSVYQIPPSPSFVQSYSNFSRLFFHFALFQRASAPPRLEVPCTDMLRLSVLCETADLRTSGTSAIQEWLVDLKSKKCRNWTKISMDRVRWTDKEVNLVTSENIPRCVNVNSCIKAIVLLRVVLLVCEKESDSQCICTQVYG